MKVVCSYCQSHINDKAPLDDERISHGMCPACEEHFGQQLDGLSLGAYLDNFPHPVIAVDGDGRLLAANRQMGELLGKPQQELAGLLGGDAFECCYARLPGGCGHTVHCETCTIRRAVRHTGDTGEPLHRQRAYVDRRDGRLDVLISTYLVGDVVKVVIDPIAP